MKKTWTGKIVGTALLLAALCAAGLPVAATAFPADRYEEVPGVRQPSLRKINREKDAEAIERIELHRAKLPVQYRERFNFAWAKVWTKAVDKDEYFAHSSIQSLDGFSAEQAAELEGISLRPEQGRYRTLCVNQSDIVDGPNCWQRSVDTEFKIVEDLAARMPDKEASGRLKLYTDLPPCASCWNAMKQFMAEYTNVNMSVLYRSK